jgi:mannose-6-phosphate isomerase-like protein (cupin superfamily)
VDVSYFISETPPGKGPSLHAHPYAEVFVVQEGELTLSVGENTVEATGGQIVVAPAGTPHKFTNSGGGRARHLHIHTHGRMDTRWLEEEMPVAETEKPDLSTELCGGSVLGRSHRHRSGSIMLY